MVCKRWSAAIIKAVKNLGEMKESLWVLEKNLPLSYFPSLQTYQIPPYRTYDRARESLEARDYSSVKSSISNCHNLTSLIESSRTSSSEVLLVDYMGEHVTKLRSYRVMASSKKLRPYAPLFSKLRRLHVHFTSKAGDRSWLSYLSSLISLSISPWERNIDDSWFLTNLTSLEHLSIQNVDYRYLTSLPSLTSLELALYDEELHHSHISNLTCLSSLSFYDRRFSNQLLFPFDPSVFTVLTQLSHIRYSSSETNDAFFSHGLQLTSLTSLDFSHTKIDQDVDLSLLNNVRHLSVMKTVTLSNGSSSSLHRLRSLVFRIDFSLPTYYTFLSNLTSLTNLGISPDNSEHSSYFFSEHITLLTSLTSLDLSFWKDPRDFSLDFLSPLTNLSLLSINVPLPYCNLASLSNLTSLSCSDLILNADDMSVKLPWLRHLSYARITNFSSTNLSSFPPSLGSSSSFPPPLPAPPFSIHILHRFFRSHYSLQPLVCSLCPQFFFKSLGCCVCGTLWAKCVDCCLARTGNFYLKSDGEVEFSPEKEIMRFVSGDDENDGLERYLCAGCYRRYRHRIGWARKDY